MNLLEYTYNFDQLTQGSFNDSTVRKYEKKGYIKFNHLNSKNLKVYWLTKKGLIELKYKDKPIPKWLQDYKEGTV